MGETYNVDEVGLPLIAGASDFGAVHPQPSRFTSAPSKKSKIGDVILCIRATIGDMNWSDKEYCLGRGVAAIRRRSENIDNNYLWRALEANTSSLAGKGRGATFKQVTRTDIAELEIPFPPIESQRYIAAILDQADSLRRLRQRAIDRLNSLGQAIFSEMFGDPTKNPLGWEKAKLGTVGTLARGISKHRPRNEPALLGGSYPLIQTGDVANADGYVREFHSTYSDIGLQQSRLWPKGTLCITIAANIGKTAILDLDACFPDSVVGFSPGDGATTEYVQYWFSFIQGKLEKDAPQSAQKNINLAILS